MKRRPTELFECRYLHYNKSHTKTIRVDIGLASMLRAINVKIHTLGSCIGHGKYHPTILVTSGIHRTHIWEYFSGVFLNKTRNFYKLDKKGMYYIPEVEAYWKKLYRGRRK